MPSSVDVLVVGAGPAGLGAAAEATAVGLEVLVVDAMPIAGGQFYAHPPTGDWKADIPEELWAGADERLLEVRLGTAAWGAFDELTALECAGRADAVRARATVLATGAIERPLPFPGWDRADVMAAGALQRLLKVSSAAPRGRVALAGSGPFLLAVAAQLKAAGTNVVAIVERRTRTELSRLLPSLARSPERLREGYGFARALRGVPMRFGVGVVAIDDDGLLLSDGSRIRAELYGIGHGFLPRLELARQIGVETEPQGARTDSWQMTNAPGVFAAGELTGIGGASLAAVEGRIAGLGAARHLGVSIAEGKFERAQRVQQRYRRFAAALARIYPAEPILALATPKTPICRCEYVQLRDLQSVASRRGPLEDPRAAKAELRCGMGACQGAICGEALRALTHNEANLGDRAHPRDRPPITPVTVGAIAETDAEDT